MDVSNVRQSAEEEQLYRGVHAPMRKAVAEEPLVTEMPKVRRSGTAGCAGRGFQAHVTSCFWVCW